MPGRRPHAARGATFATATTRPTATRRSRRQVLEELYGLHNPDEWSEEYLELLLGDLLTALGMYSYHTKRSDRSDKGWPDETIVGGRDVLHAELKKADGIVKPDQVDVITRLNRAGALVRIYRPADWLNGTIAREVRDLMRGPARPPEPWPADCYRCGCPVMIVHTDGHVPGCPIERTPRKTAAGALIPWDKVLRKTPRKVTVR